jgi:hypothetical protein
MYITHLLVSPTRVGKHDNIARRKHSWCERRQALRGKLVNNLTLC